MTMREHETFLAQLWRNALTAVLTIAVILAAASLVAWAWP
jgi:hypothetical protein